MREQTAKKYVQTIYYLQEDGDVRGAYIAREMEVSKATVSVALKTLVDEGYVVMDHNHVVHLTSQGLLLAREAIHETVHRGKSYHSILDKITTEVLAYEGIEEDKNMRWLQREKMEPALELLLVLGKHYYRVRIMDMAECLNSSSSSTAKRIRRLEDKDFVTTGERNSVALTALGTKYAEVFYLRHKAAREKLMSEGMPERDAELAACTMQDEK